VVETSTLALLRSEAGLSREEAEAGLTDERAADAALEAPASGETKTGVEDDVDVETAGSDGTKGDGAESSLGFLLAARGVMKWAGSDLGLDAGVGAETGLGWAASRTLTLRGRVAFEYGFDQSIDASGVTASVRALALRAGADLLVGFGTSAVVLGLGGGLDRTRVEPEAVDGAALSLASDSTATNPVVRLEARYEVTLGALCGSAGVLADMALVDTHYDVRQGGTLRRIAEPWPIRPGAALTIGWCPQL
jgi:hypothetical protein